MTIGQRAFDLDGRTAYVTGGCGLIGRAISEALVGAGARAIVLDTGQALADAPKLGSDAVAFDAADLDDMVRRSEEHTYELQSLMSITLAVFCLKKNKQKK